MCASIFFQHSAYTARSATQRAVLHYAQRHTAPSAAQRAAFHSAQRYTGPHAAPSVERGFGLARSRIGKCFQTQTFRAITERRTSWYAHNVFTLSFIASATNGLGIVLLVRLFLTRALEQPSLVFAVGGGDEALGADTSFLTGREHVPKLHSAMRITSVFVKDALLRHAVRDQLYITKERRWGAHGNDATLRQPNDGGVLV